MQCCALVLFCLCTLSGCLEKEVLSGLSLHEKSEAVFLLAEAGISAEVRPEQTRGEPRFALAVRGRDVSRALKILHDDGFPRRNEGGPPESGEMEQPSLGFSPDLLARQLDALAARQVEHLVSALPAVIDARAVVHVYSGERGYFAGAGGTASKPALTLFVRSRPAASSQQLTDQVRALVAPVVPEIPAEEIHVTVQSVSHASAERESDATMAPVALFSFPFSFYVAAADKPLAQRQIYALILLAGLCCFVVGLFFGNRLTIVYHRRGGGKPAAVPDSMSGQAEAVRVRGRTMSAAGEKIIQEKRD